VKWEIEVYQDDTAKCCVQGGIVLGNSEFTSKDMEVVKKIKSTK